MKTNPLTPVLLAMFAMLLLASPGFATGTPAVSNLAGQWHGTSRFTGISYAEYKQKKIAPQDIQTELHISTDGKVTGRIGGAALTNCFVAPNRGWLGRRLHLWSDFVIRGRMVGPVAPESETGTHSISAPFDYDGAQIKGALFVVCPIKYPYPFSSLRLSR